MNYNDLFKGVVVKEGYTMMALVADGGYFNAIIRREKTKDYVFCFSYDVTDGTWGQGYYCGTYAEAKAELARHIA